LQDVPGEGEFVPGYEASQWYGMGAPKNTPAEIIDKLNKEINAVLAASAIKARLADLGGTVFLGSAAEVHRNEPDREDHSQRFLKNRVFTQPGSSSTDR
jgi:tripartite-type tricarboxylate transporter receptor subunit TctC